MNVGYVACLLLAVLMPGLAEAADCVAVRQGEVSLVPDTRCAGLALKSRKRPDPPPNVDVSGTWVEYATPGNAGEWRYNDWLRKQVATLNLDRPIKLAPERRFEDRFTLDSFYRSERLISARYTRWFCCSGPATTMYSSINVAIERWTLLAPDDLLHPGAAANFCWQQFGDRRSRGEAFTSAYPRERPWSDDDFDHHRIGPPMFDMIGPVVLNPQPSRERTQRIFIAVVKDQQRWSFTEQGALIDFGDLLGPAEGPFFCTFQIVDLKEIARPGAAVPP